MEFRCYHIYKLRYTLFHVYLKLVYSINHSLLGLFYALTSLLWLFDLASGLSSHRHFQIIVHNHFIHLLYGLLMHTVSYVHSV
jgi:hypothetical protein